MKRKPVFLSILLCLNAFILAVALVVFIANGKSIEKLQQAQIATQSFFENTRNAQPYEKQPVSPPKETSVELDSNAYESYISEKGVSFVSYSENWPQEKLILLYEELLNNTYGNEIDYLKEVRIYPDAETQYVAGLQESSHNAVEINILSTLLPENFFISFATIDSTIRLYSGDVRTAVSDMARTLSHEYGHHFTNYYIFSKLDPDEWLISDYAKLRGLNPENSYSEIKNNVDYLENHMWYIQEIAAEDYIQFFGSESANQIVQFYDVRDNLNEQVKKRTLDNNYDKINFCANVIPQENMYLPLAVDVPGLSEYFSSFLGVPARSKVLDLSDLTLEFKKRSNSYDLTIGRRTYVYYEISWSAPYKDADVTYTLVCYDEDGRLLCPVKTLRGDEPQVAYIGNVSKSSGNTVYSLQDDLASGTRLFLVIAVDDKQNIAISPPQKFTF